MAKKTILRVWKGWLSPLWQHSLRSIRIPAFLLLAFSYHSPLISLELRILHVNDTHSHFDGEELSAGIRSGGASLLYSAIAESRSQKPNSLFLHAGDMFQGSPYFFISRGADTVELWNQMGLDAAVPGNHEFDLGAEAFENTYLRAARFPVLASNVRLLSVAIPSSRVFVFGQEKVGVVGILTETTSRISAAGKNLVIESEHTAALREIRALERQGVSNIILLSHAGLERDRQLARTLPGVDIIVGGHSHTPMGLPVSLHGSSFLEYPELLSNADGDPVVIVQAWQNMAALGILDVTVDGTLKRAVGRVCLLVDAKQKLPDSFSKEACVLRPQPDSAIEQWLIPRREALKTWGSKTLAALPPGVREDRLQTGYWVAASMAQATGAHIAIMNAGGVRESLKSGSINHRDIYSVLPFGNALVTIDLTGEDLSRFIETGLLFARYRNQSDIFYMHGIELAPDCVSRSFCSPKSIILLKNGMREALDPESTYRIVVNSFMASGGDGYVVSPNASVRSTDILDRDAFAAYLGMLFPPPETE